MIESIGFVIVSWVLILFALLALLAIGIGSLESRMGIARDGVPVGRRAPRWAAEDVRGTRRQSPNGSGWQVLVFADQELAFFSDLAAGLNHLSQTEPLVDVLILSPKPKEICRVISEVLELAVPIVPDAERLYRRFRVRVRPFIHVIDCEGIVRAKGVANYEETVKSFLHWARSSRDRVSGKALELQA